MALPVRRLLHARAGELRRGARFVAILGLDALAAGLALHLALWLRFDGGPPAVYREMIPVALPLLVGCRVLTNLATLLHRWSFRLAGFTDAVRVTQAGALGSVAFVLLFTRLVPLGLPRTIYVLEFFLTTAAMGALRFGPRLVFRWVNRLHGRLHAAPALIVGSSQAVEPLARGLQRDAASPYRLVGFVTSDPTLVGWRIVGRPVLGMLADLPGLVAAHGVKTLLLADAGVSARRVREILAQCAQCRIRLKILPASAAASPRSAAAMLEDLSTEDLLPRDSVPFDEREIEALVRGRRALVTGAGGSIGSELCRQLARRGVRQLVMVDINENELYLGARELAERHPGVEIHAEVADIREPEPLLRLGLRYRPEDVIHAAAHKHVPLMEAAPEEAVKNNVFGTLHVARMAQLCGAERLVLVSTDKAVRPSSVMGATKRIAELVVRSMGKGSATRMTAVRFGNVLGSAGSVVPIFRRQIAEGGPVTVTHPECTRFFMTIPEAVGLILLAGLGGHGDLCVLDMGEPIRIAELARNMITLSGLVPGEDVPIVYTGLRPGEKVFEELLTEEEERSQVVRDRIHVTESAPPPADLDRQLAALRVLADAGDRDRIFEALRALVPTYQPTPNAPPPVPRPPPAPVVAWEPVSGPIEVVPAFR